MIVGRFEPASFFQRADNVALHTAASELFGWLSRTLELPPQWAALVTRKTGGQDVVRPGGTVDGTDAEGVMFVRVTPVDISVEEPTLTSKDGFQCRADVKLRLSLVPDRGELASFQRTVLGSRRVAQVAGLASLLQPGISAALDRMVSQRNAAELVESLAHDDITAAVTEAVKAACFSAGLMIERSPVVRFDSSAFRQIQDVQQRAATARAEHEAAREVDEALSKARNQHLEHLSGLLARLKSLAESSPAVALADLIRTFSERQRGELYEALFAAESPATQTSWIVVAAGGELLFFRPDSGDKPSRRLGIEGPAGPVRSIQTFADPKLGPVMLVGAATGVYRWPIDRAEPDLTLLAPGAGEVRGGFNSAAVLGDRLFAAHSELGLWEWSLDGTGSARRLLEPLTADAVVVRCVTAFGEDIWLGIDERVIRLHPGRGVNEPTHVYTGSEATITALCPTHDGVFAGNAQGDVLHWPKGGSTNPQVLHRGMNRAAESVAALSSHGVNRIVFADTSPRVHALVVGDSFRCEYQAGGQTLRRVEVAPDLLVATNDLRDRLFFWQPGKPNEPHGTIAVSRLSGHTVQDVCLVG